MGEHQRRPLFGDHRQVYVEIAIRAPMERLWTLSQDPDLHPRWDLRFSRIVPTGREPDGPTRFRYEFRLPFHTIKGTGTSLGNRFRGDGQATSVLKFSTTDPLSPIGPGSGYWRYIPTEQGVRFVTGYNYQPGMGRFGGMLDGPVIRPLLGWATALSFDRLRLWAESDVDPRQSRNRWIIDATARSAGLLAAAFLIRPAFTSGRADAALILALGTALAALVTPSHWTVPRARRCLRRAPDRRSALAPSALGSLPSPEKKQAQAQTVGQE
ncbi:hypothetical protein QFZ40_003118 [Arthrobacter pascens]|uniref:SRPBCC family protein n=1 Tax=Arthrobacter pascens TaxID=1677 RepID=UPI0027890A80|nr:SRPBCC family protein [Arthrobacter pascens]MDQ0635209.1 hypothetical protein [Arthrobacter pascens]